jgi:hypothetical protein
MLAGSSRTMRNSVPGAAKLVDLHLGATGGHHWEYIGKTKTHTPLETSRRQSYNTDTDLAPTRSQKNSYFP